jgi:ankyrin repeat protein
MRLSGEALPFIQKVVPSTCSFYEMEKVMKWIYRIIFFAGSVLMIKANVQAQNDNLLDEFLRDRRSEVEKSADSPKLMEQFILSQKNANTRFKDGKTMMHFASVKNDSDNVKLLLKRGADINAVDNDKRTPLHEAMSYFAFDVIRLLLENDANVNMENKDGETPISSIVYWDYKKEAIEFANLFIKKGFNLKKAANADLLNNAIRRGHPEVAMIFAKNNISFNDGVLSAAAQKGYDDIFNIFLERGANPKHGVTFGDVCVSGSLSIAKTLTAKSIKPYAKDIDLCLFNGHKEAAIYMNKMLSEEKRQTVDIKERCHLKLVMGSCKANMPGAYFDEKAGNCKEISGCGGFPFDTLEACKKACEE